MRAAVLYTGSPEPSLFANMVSALRKCTGPFVIFFFKIEILLTGLLGWGPQAISKLLLTHCCCPLLGGFSYTHMRERERERERESVCVCLFLFPITCISSIPPATPTHTHQCNARLGIRWCKEKCNRHCTCTILYRFGHSENAEMFGACYNYYQNQQDSKSKPTRNWEYPPSLFGAAQNLSASRNILFIYFQVCVTRMASSQKGTMCPFSCCRQIEDVSFMDSEFFNCGKLLKIDVGKYIIPELGQMCKQISVFHEIDIESKNENGNQKLNSEILLLSLETGPNTGYNRYWTLFSTGYSSVLCRFT